MPVSSTRCTCGTSLLQAAAEGLYQAYWSEEILDEATRNLIKRLQITDVQAIRLISVMCSASPESMVVDYQVRSRSRSHDAYARKDLHTSQATTERRASAGRRDALRRA